MKRNIIQPLNKMKFDNKWVKLETLLLNEVTQTFRQILHVFSYVWMSASKL